MWRTEIGDRVLVGWEAHAFIRGFSSLVERIENEPGYRVGVAVFDRLNWGEKLAMLEIVGRGLLVSGPCPDLTAVSEGTVAAVYNQLIIDIAVEIKSGHFDGRRSVRRACRECGLDEGPPLRPCRSADDWAEAVEELMFRVLWDCDWEIEYVKPDDPPDMACIIREFMGVDDDYYTAVAPDPNPAQLAKIRSSLRELCGARGQAPP